MKDVSYGYLMKVLLTLPFTLRIQSERCLLRVSDEGSTYFAFHITDTK